MIDAHETERRLAEHCQASQHRVSPFHCAYNYTSRGPELRGIDAGFQPAVMEVLGWYWEDLHANRQIDFEMILRFAHELISTVPSIAILLSQMFRFVLIDEYQDTKEIQYDIVAHIMRAGVGRTNAFVVGDANQAIFGSLGGYAIAQAQFAADCGAPFTAKSLSVNYRSSERIVGYFSNYHVMPAAISAEGKDRLFPSKITYDHVTEARDLEDALIGLLRYNIETAGIAPAKSA